MIRAIGSRLHGSGGLQSVFLAQVWSRAHVGLGLRRLMAVRLQGLRGLGLGFEPGQLRL